MSSRRLVVEAAFGFGPLDSPTGTDWVSLLRPDNGLTRAMSASWEFGRDSDLDPFPGGRASLLLWNRDRWLDPGYSGSPYNGDLLPRVPVRIRSQNVATLAFTDEFYGFVEGGWEQVLAPVGVTACRIGLGDLLSVLEGYELPDVFEHALRDASPVGLWLFDGPQGSDDIADLSGNGHNGTAEGTIKFGEPPTTAGHSTSALFESSDSQFGRVFLGRSPIISDTGHMSVVASFKVRNASDAVNFRTLFAQGNGNADLTGFQVDVDTTGEPHVIYIEDGLGFAYQPAVNVADGQGHLVIAQSNVGNVDDFGLAIDSAVLDTTTGPGGIGSINGVGIGGAPGVQNLDHWDGWVGVVAVYDRTLTLTERQDIVEGYDKLADLRSDEHISWALDRIGVPAGARDLDAGTVTLGAADTKGRDALSWIREVVQTEGGEFYVDHRNGGVLRFRHRYARDLEASGSSSQATFSDDDGAGGVIRYSPDGLDIAPNGLDSVVNQVKVTWASGEVTVDDSASIAAYGPRPRTLQTVARTAVQARSAGEWIVARRKDPASRVRGCIAARTAAHSIDDLARDLEVGDRVTFRVHPTGLARTPIGTATQAQLHVEGISHQFQGMTWQTAFRFSSAPSFVPWIWGTGAWGTTASWG